MAMLLVVTGPVALMGPVAVIAPEAVIGPVELTGPVTEVTVCEGLALAAALDMFTATNDANSPIARRNVISCNITVT